MRINIHFHLDNYIKIMYNIYYIIYNYAQNQNITRT